MHQFENYNEFADKETGRLLWLTFLLLPFRWILKLLRLGSVIAAGLLVISHMISNEACLILIHGPNTVCGYFGTAAVAGCAVHLK